MKEIKFKLMLADNGGLQIMENGARYAAGTNEILRSEIGMDILKHIFDMCVSDVNVTIKIEEA